MRKFFLITSFILFSISSWAQTPGYIGKKFSVGYNFQFYLGGLTSNARSYDNDYISEQPNFFLDKFHEIHADYVLGKKYSLGISYRFFRTGELYKETGNSYDVVAQEYFTYDADEYLNIYGSSIIINNKFFFYSSGSALAPVGNYGQFGVGVASAFSKGKAVGTIDNNTFNNSAYEFSAVSFHDPVHTLILTGQLGNHSIFFDRIITDIGVEVALVPFGIKSAVATDVYQSGSYILHPAESYAANAMLIRLQSFYVCSVKAGIGILLF